MAIEIRKVIATDLPAILQVEQRAHIVPWRESTFKRMLDNPWIDFWVYTDSGKLKAFAIAETVLDESTLLNIAVDPAAQNGGIGRKLLRYLIQQLRGRIKQLFLEVRIGNEPAISIYRSEGFRQISLRQAYYPTRDGGREDALVFCLEIESGQ